MGCACVARFTGLRSKGRGLRPQDRRRMGTGTRGRRGMEWRAGGAKSHRGSITMHGEGEAGNRTTMK
eukprot:9495201-Pyramimonas_sp.AAC.1